jgi:hypothetical protein
MRRYPRWLQWMPAAVGGAKTREEVCRALPRLWTYDAPRVQEESGAGNKVHAFTCDRPAHSQANVAIGGCRLHVQ